MKELIDKATLVAEIKGLIRANELYLSEPKTDEIRFQKVGAYTKSELEIASWITWLEKQGDTIKIKKGKNYLCTKTHKYAGVEWIEGVKYYSPEDYSLVNQGCTCYCPKYSKEEHTNFFKEVEYDGCLEKQGEPKSIDNIKPKFHEGDWIIGDKDIFKITRYEDEYGYELTDTTGYVAYFISPDYLETDYNLWTFRDAKDGDVLASDNGVIILVKESRDSSWGYRLSYHCAILYDGTFEPTEFHVNPEKFFPATKEQRDTLLKAMKDAGYSFDFEKKELKKIEQKSAWSEEDERIYKGLDNLIYSTPYCQSRKEFSDWLKSLKQRIGG